MKLESGDRQDRRWLWLPLLLVLPWVCVLTLSACSGDGERGSFLRAAQLDAETRQLLDAVGGGARVAVFDVHHAGVTQCLGDVQTADGTSPWFRAGSSDSARESVTRIVLVLRLVADDSVQLSLTVFASGESTTTSAALPREVAEGWGWSFPARAAIPDGQPVRLATLQIGSGERPDPNDPKALPKLGKNERLATVSCKFAPSAKG